MAESVSLAVLENLVHMSAADFPIGFVSVTALIPDELSVLTEDELRIAVPDLGPRQLGDRWFDLRTSAALRVRSAVVPTEHNYLLNPAHSDFRLITIESVVPFVFDERLFGPK